jgi:hypothetical protein
MPVDAFGSVLADGRLACFFCVICFILVRTIYGGLAGAAPSPDSRVALTKKGLLDGEAPLPIAVELCSTSPR